MMARIEHGECRSCHRPVLWVFTEGAKKQILDPEPQKRVILQFDTYDHETVRTLEQAESSLVPVESIVVDTFVDHHATCPDAERWRNRGGT